MDTKIRDNYCLIIEVDMSEKRKYKSYNKEFKDWKDKKLDDRVSRL